MNPSTTSEGPTARCCLLFTSALSIPITLKLSINLTVKRFTLVGKRHRVPAISWLQMSRARRRKLLPVRLFYRFVTPRRRLDFSFFLYRSFPALWFSYTRVSTYKCTYRVFSIFKHFALIRSKTIRRYNFRDGMIFLHCESLCRVFIAFSVSLCGDAKSM